MFNVMKIEIEDNETSFRVNGIELDKSHIATLFPGEADKGLAKYLCIVPFLHERADHFQQYHELSESAAYGIAKAPELVKALGITEVNTIPFMLMCMTQAGEDPSDLGRLSDECHKAFGDCNEPEYEGNVVPFTGKKTVH
jgi:hypothetical protein